MNENKVLKLAKEFYDHTEGLCSIGPGPYGFGIDNTNQSDIGLVLVYDPKIPTEGESIFLDDAAQYEVTVEGYYKDDDRQVVLEDLPALLQSDNSDTRKVAAALEKMSGTVTTLVREECIAAFDILLNYEISGGDSAAQEQTIGGMTMN